MNTLLKYLIATRKESKNVLKTMIQNGSILVDGKVITKANYFIEKNAVITIKSKPIQNKQLKIPILYEDEYLIAVEKPAGLLSIATDKEKEETAYHLVSIYVKKRSHNGIFIVHRLDRETSGVLLFAKNENVKNILQEHWNTLVKTRGYYALVEGILSQKGTIRSFLKETKTHVVYSSKKGKEAITHYEAIQNFKDKTLLDIHIDTGRKNQIRVHMKEMGHPILGDAKYGNQKTFPRLALHAYHLEFIHPITKKNISIQSEMPSIFHL